MEDSRVSVNADVVPYLSIGTNRNKPDEESAEGKGQRSQTGRVIGRISTWPPTAAQWQERCKMKEEEEREEGGGVTFGAQNVTEKFLDDVKNMKMERAGNDSIASSNENHTHTDSHQEEQLKKETGLRVAAAARRTTNKTQSHVQAAENPADKSSSSRKEPSRAATGRRRPDKGAAAAAAGSKAPSGGASPDDETLLSGNEYAFMDLLHEVSQNHGRWTRERWRQMQANKQRR
ncbi:uncharacterized protein LOC103353438 [Stegastes partitus]|uniref:Uncharacterized protein LOC103353438 n=1 Tax=Stegastes partitus TaxID=144197 RepID=A0A9Y4MXP6_9TELE|nr:PREDICTED: uncharacterized protein LOC103353438 [Stegastes partitus]